MIGAHHDTELEDGQQQQEENWKDDCRFNDRCASV
jgi:hypothetical protein